MSVPVRTFCRLFFIDYLHALNGPRKVSHNLRKLSSPLVLIAKMSSMRVPTACCRHMILDFQASSDVWRFPDKGMPNTAEFRLEG
jgi:hypothetical protein